MDCATRSDDFTQQVKLSARLVHAQALKGEIPVDDLHIRETILQNRVRIDWKEGSFDPHATDGATDPLDMREGEPHGVRCAIRSGFHDGRPEPAELLLEDFQAVREVSTVFKAALAIDEYRQIAAHAEGIHIVEEDEPVSTEQILDVVLGRHDEDLDPGVVQEAVETRGIERSRPGIWLHLLRIHGHGDFFLSGGLDARPRIPSTSRGHHDGAKFVSGYRIGPQRPLCSSEARLPASLPVKLLRQEPKLNAPPANRSTFQGIPRRRPKCRC